MKAALHALLLLSLLACVVHAGEAEPLPAQLLRQAGAAAAPELRRATLQWWLLEKHGRLLSPELSEESCHALAASMLGAGPAVPLESLPAADDLVLQGDRLRGGNFTFIDHLIGIDGRPIAMDRQIPVLLVPLSASRAEALEKRRAEFQTKNEARLLAARWNRFHGNPVAPTYVEDGIAVRPYAGRSDDWYYHLVQEGTPYTQLAFFATIEGWPERAYHPMTGVGTPGATPPIWFNVSDLLSHGGLSAVKVGLAGGSPLKNNPFHNFAQRVLPYCQQEFAQLTPGTEIEVPASAYQLARAQRSRLAPPSVTPLFRDPARFFGMVEHDDFRLVANKSGSARANVPAVEPELPSASQNVTEAAALPYWEDSANAAPEPLTPLPAVGAGPAAAPAGPPPLPTVMRATPANAPAAASSPAGPNGTIVIPTSTFRVAVISPTIDEAEAYVQGIATNEAALAANAAAYQRARLLSQWARQTLSLLPASEPATLRTICDHALGDYTAMIESLRQERLDLLQARAAQQRTLAGKLQTEKLPALLASLPEQKAL